MMTLVIVIYWPKLTYPVKTYYNIVSGEEKYASHESIFTFYADIDSCDLTSHNAEVILVVLIVL